MINIEATCEENTKVFAPISNVQGVLKFPENNVKKFHKKLQGNFMETYFLEAILKKNLWYSSFQLKYS